MRHDFDFQLGPHFYLRGNGWIGVIALLIVVAAIAAKSLY